VAYAPTKVYDTCGHKGTADDGIKHLALNGGSQAAAARAVDCCEMALGRAIKQLKASGMWDDHIADLRESLQPSPSKRKTGDRELEMPTPGSLGVQIKLGANRLGDGRPYGTKGNSWGEYREGSKIGSAALAAAGVTRENARRVSARLAAAGVKISASRARVLTHYLQPNR